jgi:ribonuclease HII
MTTETNLLNSCNIEQKLLDLGYKVVCGIDEAGRGAWAGPLVAGCVILKPGEKQKFRDSKQLKSRERDVLAAYIKSHALGWSVGITDIDEINSSNIQSATYLAYHRAIKNLTVKPDFLLIDHYRLPGTPVAQLSLTFGDRIAQCISAASIIAKTTRDEIMKNLARDKELSVYGLGHNFGYGTRFHRFALESHGPSAHHRLKYKSIINLEQIQLSLTRD